MRHQYPAEPIRTGDPAYLPALVATSVVAGAIDGVADHSTGIVSAVDFEAIDVTDKICAGDGPRALGKFMMQRNRQ